MRNGSTIRQRQLARTLRQLREEAGLTLDEAAPKLDWSTSKLGRIETARQGVHVHGVRSMLDLYDVGGDRWTEIIELARSARQKGWWHAYGPYGPNDKGYPALEADAAVVHDYQLAYVPGLLQTADYARALFRASPPPRTEAELDRDVQVRLLRQRRLTEGPTLELVAVVDESALHRPIGGIDVMREQLRYLVEQAELPSVCFQVVPVSVGMHPGLDGAFSVLGFEEPDEPPIAFMENGATALYLEKEAEVRAWRLVFDRLRSEALSPRDSVALVRRLADHL